MKISLQTPNLNLILFIKKPLAILMFLDVSCTHQYATESGYKIYSVQITVYWPAVQLKVLSRKKRLVECQSCQ